VIANAAFIGAIKARSVLVIVPTARCVSEDRACHKADFRRNLSNVP
jgi:hypothetical protein